MSAIRRLDIGPRADGTIPQVMADRLTQIAFNHTGDLLAGSISATKRRSYRPAAMC